MKKAITLTSIASALFLAAPTVTAEEYVTLASFGDSIELKTGETALVVSTSDKLVLQYDKKTYPVKSTQFRLSSSSSDGHHYNYRVAKRNHFVPTWKSPFPLAGPCKIKLVSPGVVGMRLIGGGE